MSKIVVEKKVQFEQAGYQVEIASWTPPDDEGVACLIHVEHEGISHAGNIHLGPDEVRTLIKILRVADAAYQANKKGTSAPKAPMRG